MRYFDDEDELLEDGVDDFFIKKEDKPYNDNDYDY